MIPFFASLALHSTNQGVDNCHKKGVWLRQCKLNMQGRTLGIIGEDLRLATYMPEIQISGGSPGESSSESSKMCVI